ncbi:MULTISPECIES: Hsp20/alpha crystallin family protein [unclassified Flavobacterium]|jgi:HSP20 family protein|uniref:Hsp20/alpha crystallin family protein n=1 Tax=unclassified Flavobacterium TaxID=196869 RepID=UPI00057E5045|nr:MULTISPECIES: Hsp20/alpha crystallin family protein [unclassified Flavobacterium]KIA94380.1 heat-shock protein [Flavobacterium sp. KMS]MEA9415312.1 Hsp20/alpha crystallin family protein [Flavobacterium sp. PL02]
MLSIRNNGNNTQSFPSLLDDFFGRELFNWENSNFSSTSTTIPSINIKETDENFEVEVAAPGMDKKDFNVTLNDNLLTISSVKQNEKETVEDNYTRKEFSYQSFQRSFELPNNIVDEEKIKAHYDNGLLHLVIPKKEEAKESKSPRVIEIS